MKSPLKNEEYFFSFNNVKDYLNMANAFDFVKWQGKLRSYEKPIKK